MTQARRFGVRPDKEEALAARLAALGVREVDLDEQFVRARGPGGQNVNKVSTAVRLRHVPSGIEVRVEQGRSQGLNRFLARRALADRLEEKQRGSQSPQAKKVAKLRRQKDRRRRRSKSGAAE